MNSRQRWKKIKQRGPVVGKDWEPARSAGYVYPMRVDGLPDYDADPDPIGSMPATYYQNHYYHYGVSVTALQPVGTKKDQTFEQYLFDDDEGIFDDRLVYTQYLRNFLHFETEAHFQARMKQEAKKRLESEQI